MNILITGSAGFIGFHLSRRLLKDGLTVIGIDNLNNYYDPNLKLARLNNLKNLAKNLNLNFIFFNTNIVDAKSLKEIFKRFSPDYVVNLAAQAGVRYSINNPSDYVKSNLVGFGNILEECKLTNVKHLVYASSSSVYGGNKIFPYSENQRVDHPISIYGATKRSNELMAHTYSHLFNIPTTGLRFFTVYGPWGRPDMALSLFTKAILKNEPIKVYNQGKMNRSFTYIDDIVEGLIRIIKKPATPNKNFIKEEPLPNISWAPFRIFNIGNPEKTSIMRYIEQIEFSLGKTAIKDFLPLQDGEVKTTEADTDLLEDWVDFKPKIGIKEGVRQFVSWYKSFY